MSINASNIIPCRTASCSVMGDYALKKKQTVSWANKKIGDIILYDFNHNGTSDHTGIIVGIRSDGKIDVVEGNTSETSNDNGGNVMRRTRSKSQVNYVVRPKYDSKVTAKMVVATAISQLGIKENPKNSNKVKYNTWYYGKEVKGSAYPWCMTFVEWCFAHVLETISKPTGKYSGAMPVPTIQRNTKNSNVKNLQNFLNWYHPSWKLAVDGDCGEKTLTAIALFQMTEGLEIDGVFGSASTAKANTYKGTAATPSTPTPTPTPSTPTPTPTPTVSKVIGKCIDVSYWQAKISVANWKKIKNTCEYAICRASYTSLGSFTLNKDSTFDNNAKNAKSAGLKVGAYHFSQALSVAEAQKEANYLCDILDKYTIDFWVACDYETNAKGRLNGKTASTKASEIANAFCDVVAKRGYKAVIYANYTMMTKYLKSPKYPIWLAQYNDTKSYDKNVVMWQYTSEGRVDGISASNTNNKTANVDLSYVYEAPTITPKPVEPTLKKPSGKYTMAMALPTITKGSTGENVSDLQRFLNWYGAFGLEVDGDFGTLTDSAVRAYQKTEGIEVDGIYGSNSFAKAQSYASNASKLCTEMKQLAWAYGTSKAKYDYSTGAPKASCSTAMKKYGYSTKAKMSDCGNFVNTVVRETGIDKSFTSLHAVKTAFPTKEDMFDIVWSGMAIPSGTLKPGDIIRYKKTNNSQHAMFYFGNDKVCDAGHYDRFGNIRKDEKRYANSNVKVATIQVLRVKE